MIVVKNASQSDMDFETMQALDQEIKKTGWLGFGHFRNKAELLYIHDDEEEEEKELQGPLKT